MALACDYCGHKSNEVKGGSGISEKGKLIKLRITEPLDMTRDILKVIHPFIHTFKVHCA